MAVKTRAELIAQNNSTINTNAVQAITGKVLNTFNGDFLDSALILGETENYIYFNDVDPATIGVPDADKYYQGIYNEKRWMKTSDGRIIYSSTGVWTIIDNSDVDIDLLETWLGTLIRWTGSGEATTITLDNSVYNFPVGWNMAIYNDTPDEAILITTGGTDVLRSHNNLFYIPAYSYARIGIISIDTVTEWYADIQQNLKNGLGVIGENGGAFTIGVAANTWTEIVMPTPAYGELINIEAGSVLGRLRVNFPDNGTNNVYITMNGHASLELQETNQTVDMTFGVDGVVSASADILRQSVTNGGNQTTDLFFPFGLSFEGLAPNGSELSLFIRSDDAATVGIQVANFQLRCEAMQGVDVNI